MLSTPNVSHKPGLLHVVNTYFWEWNRIDITETNNLKEGWKRQQLMIQEKTNFLISEPLYVRHVQQILQYLHHSLATRLITLYEIPGLNITEKPYISHISDATSFDKAVSCSPQISAFLKLHSHQIDNYFSGNHISECIFWAIKSRKMIENSWRQELVSSGEKPFMSLQRLEAHFHTSIWSLRTNELMLWSICRNFSKLIFK